MSCQDMCVVMYYEGHNTFYKEQIRSARKQYHCCECIEKIEIGEKYQCASGRHALRDDGFWTFRTCMACVEIRDTFSCGGSWVFTELWESIRDQMFDNWDEMKAIDCLSRLKTDAAVNKMRQKYEEYKDGLGR